MHRLRFGAVVLASSLVLSSCAGGQTGDSGDVGAFCSATAEDVELDEVTPTGFSAREVLALAEGVHTAPGYAFGVDGDTWAYEYSVDVSHEVTVEVSYAGGARYIVFDYTDPSSDELGGPKPGTLRPVGTDASHRCGGGAIQGGLEVDVTVHVSAPEYDIDESFAGVLYGSPEWAQLEGPLGESLDIGQVFFSTYGMAGVAELSDWDGVQWPLPSERCIGRWPWSPSDGSPSIGEMVQRFEQGIAVVFGPPDDSGRGLAVPEHEGSVALSGPQNICGSPNIDGDVGAAFEALLTLDQDGKITTVPARVLGTSFDGKVSVGVGYQCSTSGADSLPVCGDLGVEQGAFDDLRQTISVNMGQNAFGDLVVSSGEIRIEGITSDCSLDPEPDGTCPEEPFPVMLEYTKINSPDCCPL